MLRGAALLAAAAVLVLGGGGLAAQDLGQFPGYTLKVKLIGGTQYEPLYTRIPDWEKATGAKVQIVSSKNYFDLDREIKQDIAAGPLTWCVGSNHTSFAAQYGDHYLDLTGELSKAEIARFNPLTIQHSTVEGRLVQLPRHSDISNVFYKKSLFADPALQAEYKTKTGKDLAPPETWEEFKQQAIFFAKPPNLYGTAFAGKDEGLTGRFYEMLVAEGGQLFDADWNPTFNSPEGVRALQWFVDLYAAKAVPAGTVNYLWDDLGQGFASGSIALDLDWSGWSAFFNDPKTSKIADDVGIARAPKGSSGRRSGWSGSHSFSVTNDCDNKEAGVSFVRFITDYESQMLEARRGLLPTDTRAFADAIAEFKAQDDAYMVSIFETFRQSMSEDAFTPPLISAWIESSNAIWPELQAAIVGQKAPQEALDAAAEKVTEVMEDTGYLQ